MVLKAKAAEEMFLIILTAIYQQHKPRINRPCIFDVSYCLQAKKTRQGKDSMKNWLNNIID